MADAVNGIDAPATNDVEMKEETAETFAQNMPSAPEQIPTMQADQSAAVQTDPVLGVQPDRTPNTQPTPASTAMEGLLNGALTGATSTSQAQAPPVIQAPSASPLPATAPPAPVAVQVPVSAPTPSPAPPTRPSSIPPSMSLPPEKPHAHGSPTRVYLNQAVTPHLLEGMKYLAAYEPEKPLKWLSEFLAKRSTETEGES